MRKPSFKVRKDTYPGWFDQNNVTFSNLFLLQIAMGVSLDPRVMDMEEEVRVSPLTERQITQYQLQRIYKDQNSFNNVSPILAGQLYYESLPIVFIERIKNQHSCLSEETLEPSVWGSFVNYTGRGSQIATDPQPSGQISKFNISFCLSKCPLLIASGH